MNVKELFGKSETGTLTYEEFAKLSEENKVKFVDLNEGEYVSKHKYQAELDAKAKEIETLNSSISTRDGDLETLKKQLEEAGTDSAKLEELNTQLSSLQGKYDADVKAYKDQLKTQAYEFGVREFANTLKFSSEAAKRDFIREMNAAGLKMDKQNILGATDFKESYQTTNPDAFIVENSAPTPEVPPAPEVKPQFVQTTPGVPVTKPTSLTDMMKMANENPGMAINF